MTIEQAVKWLTKIKSNCDKHHDGYNDPMKAYKSEACEIAIKHMESYARLEQENAQLMNRCFVITNGFLCSSCILSDKCHFFEKFVGKEGSNGTFNH